jgi:hypothetical protein
MDAPPNDLIDMRAAAHLLHISTKHLRRWRQQGRFRSWRRGGRYFASRAEVLAFFQPAAEPRSATAVPRPIPAAVLEQMRAWGLRVGGT